MKTLKTRLKQTIRDFKNYNINYLPLFKGESLCNYSRIIKKKFVTGTLFCPMMMSTTQKMVESHLTMKNKITFTILPPPWTSTKGILILQTEAGNLVISTSMWEGIEAGKGLCADKNTHSILIPNYQKSIEKELIYIIRVYYGITSFHNVYTKIRIHWT